MGLFDAAEVKISNKANPYQVQGLDFATAYQNSLRDQGQARGQQQDWLNAMGQLARGEGALQAASDAQFRQQAQQGQAAIAGQIASNRALSPAARAFLASRAAGTVGANAAASVAQTRAQQQMAAQQAYGAGIAGMRGQDITASGQAASGQLGQEQLKGQNYNTALGYNVDIGKTQAGYDAQANQAMMGGINGVAGAAEKIFSMTPYGAALNAGKSIAQGATGNGVAATPGIGFNRNMANGGNVDSPANDTVPAMLSPGERVVPRSISHDPEQTRDFIAALNEMDAGKKPSGSSDGFIKALAAKQSETERRIQFLEQALRGNR